MRIGIVVLWMLLCAITSITSATAQVSIGIGFPGVSIGINLPVYPQLVAVPGYPVYYAPQVSSNYFFYDGMYWVFQRDNWYASSWYNGPWALVSPELVPLFVLRVPVRYYRQPPVYFRGWRSDAPPRWGEHWGNTWEQHHSGWDRWDRRAVPAPAPLPVYQRQYSGSRYPHVEQQQTLQGQNYRYQPRDPVVQQHYRAQQRPSAPASAPTPPPQARQPAPHERAMPQQDARGTSRTAPPQTSMPQDPQSQHGATQQPSSRAQGQDRAPQVRSPVQESAGQRPTPQPHQAAVQRPPQPAKAPSQDKAPHGRAPAQEPAAQHSPQQPQQGAMQRQQHQAPKGRGEDKGSDRGEQQGGERNK
jgi:hypothetical protein